MPGQQDATHLVTFDVTREALKYDAPCEATAYDVGRGKDPTVFPHYTAEVQASLQREPAEMIQSVLDGEGTLASLLGTTDLPVDPVLGSRLPERDPIAAGRPPFPTQGHPAASRGGGC